MSSGLNSLSLAMYSIGNFSSLCILWLAMYGPLILFLFPQRRPGRPLHHHETRAPSFVAHPGASGSVLTHVRTCVRGRTPVRPMDVGDVGVELLQPSENLEIKKEGLPSGAIDFKHPGNQLKFR